MVGGKLVAMSVDVYISMEFGAEGDLFNLRRVCCQRLPFPLHIIISLQ